MTAIVAAVALLIGCAGTSRTESVPVAEWQPSRTIVLVSIDGFRPDFLELHNPANLSALAESGVRADALIPVFPTKTFPNLYSMVTGLYPAHHGIVSNTMYDPERDSYFSIGNREAVTDPAWWGGEPIWVTAEKQGRIAATYFWVGSESPVDGIRPTFWKQYDESVPGSERVRQVLKWLDLSPAQRPSFISLYFSGVDGAGHAYGPHDARTGEAVRAVDVHIGELVSGLKDRGLFDAVNLVIVSDHGMAARSPDHVIFLDDFVDLDEVQIVDWSPVLALRPRSMSVDSLYERLHGAHPRLAVYRRADLPARLRYASNARIMPIIGLADEGWSVARREGFSGDHYGGGMHGYDNALRSMQGIFIAHGPAFRSHVRVPAFESVHLYELMADILGVDPAPNDGSLSATAETRRKNATKPASS